MTSLRQLLDAPEILVAPGAYDGTGARLAESMGFRALYVSGFETSASLLGLPDVGYLTLTQMVQRVATICDVVGANQDTAQPVYFGRPYQVHDGLADIIRGFDFVTVSYNNLFEHDKSILIGSTNTPGVDVGKLRVTLHHNRFANLGQRMPRVRFGQVDVYNNYFYATDEDTLASPEPSASSCGPGSWWSRRSRPCCPAARLVPTALRAAGSATGRRC